MFVHLLCGRRYDTIVMNLMVTVLLSVFTSMSAWRDLGTHKSSGPKRQAVLFFCVIHQGIVSSLQVRDACCTFSRRHDPPHKHHQCRRRHQHHHHSHHTILITLTPLTTTTTTMAPTQGTHSFPLERSLILRERAAGTYRVSAYFLAKYLADFFTQVPAPIIFSCIVYPVVGLSPGIRKVRRAPP
jgi:hypothetical protein